MKHRKLIAAVLLGVIVVIVAIGAVACVRRETPAAPAKSATPGTVASASVAALHNEGVLVRPDGVPYTYRIPPGWVPAVKKPDGAKKLTSVGPPEGPNGYPSGIVSVELRGMTDSDKQAETIFRAVSAGQSPPGPGWTMQHITVAAGKALQVSYIDPGGEKPGGRHVYFDRPTATPVLVTCQWIKFGDKQAALAACDYVVSSLTIT